MIWNNLRNIRRSSTRYFCGALVWNPINTPRNNNKVSYFFNSSNQQQAVAISQGCKMGSTSDFVISKLAKTSISQLADRNLCFFAKIANFYFGNFYLNNPTGIRTKWPSGRRTPLYNDQYNNLRNFRNCDLLENQAVLCCNRDRQSKNWIVLPVKLCFFAIAIINFAIFPIHFSTLQSAATNSKQQ